MSSVTPSTARLHDIYRMRDLSGRLLYIGVTNGGLRRFMEHSKDKTWWREVAQIDVEHVNCTRQIIEAMERDAIRDEQPLYNVVHNGPAKAALPAPSGPIMTASLAKWPDDPAVDMWNGSDCTFEALVALNEPRGVTAKRWRKATSLPDRTFYRHRHTLVTAGCVLNVGTETAPLYAPSEAHIKPPPPSANHDPYNFLSPDGGQG